MKRLFGGLLMAGGAAVLAAGAMVLMEKLLARPSGDVHSAPKLPLAKPARHFSIKKTSSEVGYAYWILQGFGPYKCYLLCDTWEEAITEMRLRIGQVDTVPAGSNS